MPIQSRMNMKFKRNKEAKRKRMNPKRTWVRRWVLKIIRNASVTLLLVLPHMI